jgi:hypothetical protein
VATGKPQYLQCMDSYRKRAQSEKILVGGQGLKVLACAAKLP